MHDTGTPASEYVRRPLPDGGQGFLAGVPLGQYFVRVHAAESASRTAMARVTVQDSDLTVELNPTEMPGVSGVVTKENGVEVPPGVSARVVNLQSQRIFDAAVAANGRFAIPGVIPGPYEIALLGSASAYLKTVHIGAKETRVFDVADEGVPDVRISAGIGGGSISGVVMENGKPVYGVMAVLAPEGLPNGPNRYRGFQTDSDGSFEWSNLEPGSYRLFSVPNSDFEYRTAAKLKPFVKDAKLIVLGPGDSFRETITVIE